MCLGGARVGTLLIRLHVLFCYPPPVPHTRTRTFHSPAVYPYPDLCFLFLAESSGPPLQLDRLLPPLMSCLLHIDFERRGDAAGAGEAGTGTLSALPPKWTHWKVRDYAAELLRAICDK